MTTKISLNGKPIQKEKGFCPNPVVKYGIPDYADSYSNVSVVGTEAHRQWWIEQFDYCMNGYNTGGLWIPGRYYFFLNYCTVVTPGVGRHYPMFIDFQYEFFLLIEYCKKKGKGLIVDKARRKGLSECVANGVISHGIRFGDNYQAGIAAGLEKHSMGFYRKFARGDSVMPPELRINYLHSTPPDIIAGYEEIKDTGGFVKTGSNNSLYVRTMFTNPSVFKGEALDDCVFEEAGEFNLLLKGYNATKHCFMVGDEMVGTPYIYGTGGNILSSSKDFVDIWYEADKLNLEKFWVRGTKMYFPCVAGYFKNGEKKEDIPYLKKLYPKEYMRIGMQDEMRAKELIMDKRKILLSKKDKQEYYDELQNCCLSVEESFLSSTSNHYDAELLTEAKLRLMHENSRYGMFVLEYVMDGNGLPIFPRKVKCRLAQTDKTKPGYDEPGICIKIRHDGHPVNGFYDLDIGGIDGYDIDQSKVSKSLGSMVVRRRYGHEAIKGGPIALIYNRPKRKEMFYENCFKASIYWKLNENTLIDAGSPGIIDYYMKNGGEKYLSPRPRTFESPNSEQGHTYGMKFTTYNRPMLEGLMQAEIVDHIEDNPFPELIKDFSAYNSNDNDTDCDGHDAYLLTLAREKDMRKMIRNIDTNKNNNDMSMPTRTLDEDGNVIIVSGTQRSKSEITGDLFIEMYHSGSFDSE